MLACMYRLPDKAAQSITHDAGKQIGVYPDAYWGNVVSELWPQSGAWQAIFSLVLVVVGFLQFRVYRGQHEIMAKQAEIAKQAFIATHRPRLVIRDMTLIESPLTPDHPTSVRFLVVNVGESDAVERESHVEAHNVGAAPFGTQTQGRSFIRGERFSAGESRIYNIQSPTNWPTIQNIKNRQINNLSSSDFFVFRGAIVYRDENGVTRRTAVWRSYDFRDRRFRATDDTDYEYAD